MSKAQGNKNTGEGGGGAQELIFFNWVKTIQDLSEYEVTRKNSNSHEYTLALPDLAW